MKIGFVTDTNVIALNEGDKNKDVNFLKNTRYFLEYIESLKKLNTKVELVYIMPTIIIEELYNQKLSAYDTRYEVFAQKYLEMDYGLFGK